MPLVSDQNVLLAYAVGNDLHDVAPAFRRVLKEFVGHHAWKTDQIAFVDDVHEPDPSFPDFPPDWCLGLNLGLDHAKEDPDWFTDVLAIAEKLRDLYRDTGRESVLELAFSDRHWYQEYLCSIDQNPLDIRWLREAIARLIRLQ